MPLENDAFVAEIILREGLLDPAQLQRGLEIQWAAATVGMDENLLDVLRTKGILSERDALALQDELTLPELVSRPEQIEGYRVLQSLGQSGLGALFLAAETRSGGEVAVRVLSPRLARDPSVVERFTADARALCSLRHTNLGRGITWGQSRDHHYCVLQLVEGQSLAEELKSGTLAIASAVKVGRYVAAGLGHMHGLGIVHGDVRPGHVYVTTDGRVTLVWPGRVIPPAASGMPAGTPYYLSPEVAQGAPTPGPQSDIYSLGATLYHVLTGRPVVQAESASVACQRQVEMPPTPPASVRSDMPRALNDLLLRMLAKAPAARPREAEEVIQLLLGVVTAAPAPRTAAPPPMPTAPAPAAVQAQPVVKRKHGMGAAWTLLICLLLCGLGVAVVWAVRRQRVTSARAAPERRRAGPPAKKKQDAARKGERTAQPPPRKAEPKALDEAALRLVQDALALDRAEGTAHGEVLLALRRAALAAGDDTAGRQVAARLAARELRVSTEARTAYDTLVKAVQSLRETDGFGDALRRCAAFPPGLRVGVWQQRVDALAVNLSTQVEQRYLELAMLGVSELRRERLDEGVAAYARIAKLGVPWITAEGQRLHAAVAAYAEGERARIDAARVAETRLKKWRLPGQLTRTCITVEQHARHGQFADALKLLDEAGEKVTEAANVEAIARMRARLVPLVEFWKAIEAGPHGAVGGELTAYGQPGTIVGFGGPEGNKHVRVRIKATGGTVSLALNKLAADQIVQIASHGNGGMAGTEWRLRTALYLLARGEQERGREALLAAKALGADVAPYLGEIALAKAVDSVLGAAEKDDPKARELIEGLLDNHGSAAAVIVNHRELMAAWKRLGGTAGASDIEKKPLPDELLSLVLLPRTRIGPTAASNPAATSLTSPLERASPVVLGLASWADYSLSIRWTVEEPAELALFFRLEDPTPGGFRCGVLSIAEDRLEVGQLDGDTYEAAAARQAPDLGQRRGHRARITVQGATVAVTVDDMSPVRMTLKGLARGNVGIAVPRGKVFVHELGIAFPHPVEPPKTSR
jgi:serine/threonine-protein kinase